MEHHYSAEFRIIIDCCLRFLDERVQKIDGHLGQNTHAQTISTAQINWHHFLKLVFEHKLSVPVNRYVDSACSSFVPEWVSEQLKKRCALNTRWALGMTAELVRLIKLLGDDGIPALSLKGPALSLELFGDVAVRESKDLDILIGVHDLKRADQLLKNEGYRSRQSSAAMTDRQKASHQLREKDKTYFSMQSKIPVELHWKMLDYPHLLSVEDDEIWRRVETRPLHGRLLTVLEREINLLYLCAHGATHGWKRLFWVLDIAMFVRRFGDDIDWKGLCHRANAYGTKRSLTEGLLLAHGLFASSLPEAPRYYIQQDAVVQSMARQTLISSQQWREDSLADRLLLTKRTLKLHSSKRFKLQVIFHPWIPREEDWALIPLSDRWFGLYYVMRPFIALYRKCRTFFASAVASMNP
jgi:hypothetical protein